VLTTEEMTRLAQHLMGVLGAKHIHVSGIKRYHGGASRETYGLDIEVDGNPIGIIVRRDPADSLIDTERATEYAALASFASSGVPVPKLICLNEASDCLGAPFFVMERVDGGEAGSPFDPASFAPHRDSVGRHFFDILGRIHARDAAESALGALLGMADPDTLWSRELDYWAKEIETNALEPQPIGLAAVRFLRRTPPPPPRQQTIVHGDYRIGNFLHDGSGQIAAVLDWEMAHIGDPHEDLAWALDPLWNIVDPALATGLIPRAEAIEIWERSSGLRFDPDTFRWWEMFATIKGLGIWLSAAKAYAEGRNTDPVLAFSGLYPLAKANQILATRLLEAAES
jgi:aminoglycoside phosphotransferase (APT) family kinase protein